MGKDLLLVFSIYQGQNFRPQEGCSVVIKGHLESHTVSTDLVPLTAEPAFSTEVSWQLDGPILRNYKLHRTPIRAECVCIDKNGQEKEIGHIIIKLHTAVLGIKSDPQWVNLQGVKPHNRYKDLPPRVLMALNLQEAPNIQEAPNQDDDDITHLQSVNPATHNSHQDFYQPSASSQQNSVHSNSRSRNSIDDIEILPAHSGDKGESSGYRVSRSSARNTPRPLFNGGEKHAIPSNYGGDKQNSSVHEDIQMEVSFEQNSSHGKSKKVEQIPKVIDLDEDEPEAILNNNSNISKGQTSSWRLNSSTSMYTPDSTDFLKDIQRRVDKCQEVLSSDVGKPNLSLVSRRRSNKMAYMGFRDDGEEISIIEDEEKATASSGRSLSPVLNQDGGFFQIGSPEEANEKFEFSVTIVFAKGLEETLPSDLKRSDGDSVVFTYSLLGYDIRTDPVGNLQNPDFLAERAAANIHSSAANVSAYFRKHPELRIQLLIGDLCLATALIDMSLFGEAEDMSSTTPLKIEGGYQLIPGIVDRQSIKPGNEPLVGVVLQLAKESVVQSSGNASSQKGRRNVDISTVSMSTSDDSDLDNDEIQVQGGHMKEVDIYTTKKKYSSRDSRDLVCKDVALPADKWERCSYALDENRQKLDVIRAAAMEWETWKEDQQELFWKKWCNREVELQQHLATEWEVRVRSIESRLHGQLADCELLQQRLTSALASLARKEQQLLARENRMKSIENKLELEGVVIDTGRKLPHSTRLPIEDRETQVLREELRKEQQLCRRLGMQVEQLKSLRTEGRGNNSIDIGSVREENEVLVERLSEANKRKQHYKAQWVQSLKEVHELRKIINNDIQGLRCEVERSSPEPYYVHSQTRRTRAREEEVPREIRSRRRARLENNGV